MSRDRHPSNPALSALLARHRAAAGPLWAVYNDLVLAQRCTPLELIDLVTCARPALLVAMPSAREQADAPKLVVPCSLAESLSIDWIRKTFDELALAPSRPVSDQIYLAISSPDSSIVYYKISRGIVKPPV